MRKRERRISIPSDGKLPSGGRGSERGGSHLGIYAAGRKRGRNCQGELDGHGAAIVFYEKGGF